MTATSTSNFATTADAIAAIQAHPMCSEFMTTPTKYVVFYPDAYKIPGGAAVPIGTNQVASLTLLYQQVDAFWQAQRLQIPASAT